jgi:hypothetical protein
LGPLFLVKKKLSPLFCWSAFEAALFITISVSVAADKRWLSAQRAMRKKAVRRDYRPSAVVISGDPVS